MLDIADRALRADIAEACEDAGIAVAYRGDGQVEADLALIDRPVATVIPAVAIAPDEARRNWPATVRAVVPADADAGLLAAVITVVAAGYALRRDEHASVDETYEDAGEGGDSVEGENSVEGGLAADGPGEALSSREREVLALLAGGASNKEIALALGVSVSTVKFHVAAIMEKLGARSRVDAVAIAIRSGMVMV
jgi:DNA-binding NarL/FixJ family response regulator